MPDLDHDALMKIAEAVPEEPRWWRLHDAELPGPIADRKFISAFTPQVAISLLTERLADKARIAELEAQLAGLLPTGNGKADAAWDAGYDLGSHDEKKRAEASLAAKDAENTLLRGYLAGIGRVARSDGDRTFDQCITALMHIDDLVRSVPEAALQPQEQKTDAL